MASLDDDIETMRNMAISYYEQGNLIGWLIASYFLMEFRLLRAFGVK